MAKKIAVILAEGFEEIEAIAPIDVLRRAGIDVIVAGLSGKTVTGAHGVKVEADIVLGDMKGLPDAIFLPGGLPGATNLEASPAVIDLIRRMHQEKRLVTAICASPALALQKSGILEGKRATCYPGYEKNFSSGVTFTEERVVKDGNVITSRGPGSAIEFALKLVEELAGKEKAAILNRGLVVKP